MAGLTAGGNGHLAHRVADHPATERLARWLFRVMPASRRRVYDKLTVYARRGGDIQRALEILHAALSDDGRRPWHPSAMAVRAWLRAIRGEGAALSEAAADWLPPEERVLLAAGRSVPPETVLASLDQFAGRVARWQAILFKAVGYPLVLFALALAMTIAFSLYLAPGFQQLATQGGQGGFRFTGEARALLDTAAVIQAWWPFGLAGLAAGGAGLWWSLPRWTGALRAALDRYPPFSLYRLHAGSSFLFAFAALLRTDSSQRDALVQLRAAASPWMAERLDAVIRQISGAGLTLGQALRQTGYDFPAPELNRDLVFYSETGGTEEAVQALADTWTEQGEKSLAAMSTLLRTIALAAIGFLFLRGGQGFYAIIEQLMGQSGY